MDSFPVKKRSKKFYVMIVSFYVTILVFFTAGAKNTTIVT